MWSGRSRLCARALSALGEGDLDFRLDIKTGDEIENLAEEFNKMTGALQEAYKGLEQKVKERTQELSETLERQTAIAEMLRVMAKSLTNLPDLLDAMIANAVRLAQAKAGVIRLYDEKGLLRFVAYHRDSGSSSFPSTWDFRTITLRPDEESATTWAVRERKPVHIRDIQNEPHFRGPVDEDIPRTVLAVPLLQDGVPFGAIVIFRDVVEPFTDRQIELVTTFADQAVIAIQHVHLFQELQTRTTDLARSVEELKALGEVSQAVSSSLDLRTVLTSVVSHAVRLSGSDNGGIYEYDEQTQELLLRATNKLSSELIEAIEEVRIPLNDTVVGRTIANREPVQITDILAETHYPLRDILERMGTRALLGVPLMREETVVGALIVGSQAARAISKRNSRSPSDLCDTVGAGDPKCEAFPGYPRSETSTRIRQRETERAGQVEVGFSFERLSRVEDASRGGQESHRQHAGRGYGNAE